MKQLLLSEYARLYTSCTKGHYLINGCNETEWAHACTRRVANIPASLRSESLRGFQDFGPMMKYCNEGIIDRDYECLVNATDSLDKDACPAAAKAMNEKADLK